MSSHNAIPIRVYLEDTDAGGVVFYANYLKFFERARTELVRQNGFEMRACLEDGISFVVTSISVDYKASAFLDDEVLVSAKVIKLKRSYFEVEQTVVRADSPDSALVVGRVKVACVNLEDGKPRALPVSLSQSLTKLEM